MSIDRTEKLIIAAIVAATVLAAAALTLVAAWDDGQQAGCRKTGGRVEPTTCAPVLICNRVGAATVCNTIQNCGWRCVRSAEEQP